MFKKKKQITKTKKNIEIKEQIDDKQELKEESSFKEELKELAIPIGMHEAMSAFYKIKLIKHVVFKGGKIIGQQANKRIKERKVKKK